MKLTERKRLALFAAAILGIPALLSQAIPDKTEFEAEPLHRLKANQPDLILIGDSMIDAAIDPELLEERLGADRTVELIWDGGAASATWYLALKNYVIGSGVKPRAICIFFRDRLLTNPSFRTSGAFRRSFESVMLEDEPAIRQVLGEDAAGEGTGLERWATRLYPVNARRHVYQERIARTMFQWIGGTRPAAKSLELLVNQRFDVAKLRGERMEEAGGLDEEQARPFDPDPSKSFLPHMVDAAARAGLPLAFVRVKRHPAPDGRVPQSESLRRYVSDLRAWLESRGRPLVDLTGEPALSPDMYLKANDDHIGPWAQRRATEIYAEKLRPLLMP